MLYLKLSSNLIILPISASAVRLMEHTICEFMCTFNPSSASRPWKLLTSTQAKNHMIISYPCFKTNIRYLIKSEISLASICASCIEKSSRPSHFTTLQLVNIFIKLVSQTNYMLQRKWHYKFTITVHYSLTNNNVSFFATSWVSSWIDFITLSVFLPICLFLTDPKVQWAQLR